MNPYPIIAGILIFVLSLGGAYYKGRKDCVMDAIVIQQAANKESAEMVREVVIEGLAKRSIEVPEGLLCLDLDAAPDTTTVL